MYEILPYILSACFVLLGLFMVIMPKQATKKSQRESEDVVKKTRRNGFVVIACGIVLLLIDMM